MPGNARGIQDQVAAIVAAAEKAGERMRQQAEEQMKERIAEGIRAGENQVQAAEAEAEEIIALARTEADRLREDGRSDAEASKTQAAGDALEVVARATDQADVIRAEAEQVKTEATSDALAVTARAQDQADQVTGDAEARARELLRGARTTASEIRVEGLELVDNLRAMGDSLRSNSERLLRDVQLIHSRMVAQIDRADGGAGIDTSERAALTASGSGRRERQSPELHGDELDVPEFLPPR